MTQLIQLQAETAVVAGGALAPSDVHAFSPGVVTIGSPAEKTAEAIRVLRTHIMAQHVDEGRRALAVCAPGLGVGCTFVAVNLAVALSQIGIKTLLMDADLRNPSVHKMIQPPRPLEGLRQCLASYDLHFGDAIDYDVLPNLSVMYSGGAAANPQELLASDRFRTLMDFCLRDFDLTIVDTPPANTCSDARRVSTVVGYSLIVAGRDKTYVHDIKTLVDQLRGDHARVIGTTLNEA